MAQIIDERTTNHHLPLPASENPLSVDVVRISEAISELDRIVAVVGHSDGYPLGFLGSPGSAVTSARSDHVHPFPRAIDIGGAALTSTITPENLNVHSAIGESNEAARADHVHPLPSIADFGGITLGNTIGAALSSNGAVGSASTAAHTDHSHPYPTAVNVGAASSVHSHSIATTESKGFMSSTDKTNLNALVSASTSAIENMITLSDVPAANLNVNSLSGISSTAARSDHVHIYPTPAQIGAASTDEENTWTATQFHTSAICENAVSMTTNTINFLDASLFIRTITEDTLFVVQGNLFYSQVASFILELINGGAYSVTWWQNVLWMDGIEPVLTVSGRDVLAFYTPDSGASWRGFLLATDIKTTI